MGDVKRLSTISTIACDELASILPIESPVVSWIIGIFRERGRRQRVPLFGSESGRKTLRPDKAFQLQTRKGQLLFFSK